MRRYVSVCIRVMEGMDTWRLGCFEGCPVGGLVSPCGVLRGVC